MDPGNVHHGLCCFIGGGQLWQSNESSHLRKSVHLCGDSGVTLRYREPRDKVYGDVGPWSGGDGKRLQEAHAGRNIVGTNNQFSGHPLSGGTLLLACLTSFSICQVTAPTTQVSGRIVSGSLATGSRSKSWDRASGLTFHSGTPACKREKKRTS